MRRCRAEGYYTTSKTPANLDALLPLSTEPESAWLIRRAATEVTHDPGLRFLRYAGVVMPEPTPGQRSTWLAASMRRPC